MIAGAKDVASANRDCDELLTRRESIAHRRRFSALGQWTFPELLTGLDVEGMQPAVERSADEDNATGGDDRAAEIHRAPLGIDARRCFGREQSRERAEGNVPQLGAGLEIDSDERAEGWWRAGKPGWAAQDGATH